MKWTPQQRAGIETVGRSLLVSAAAGSGKTAVLAERCAYLVCDAKEKCDVDELLVVTFTKSAATEMRLRIESALRQRLETSDDPRLLRQIMLLNRAQISTLHGFCTTVLRQHFHQLGLDPNFRVLDEEEVKLLRHEVAKDLLADRYETDSSGQFQNFVDLYGNGQDEIVIAQVLHLDALMASVVDPDAWLKKAVDYVMQSIDAKSLTDSFFGKRLTQNVRQQLDDLLQRWINLAERLQSIVGLESYGEYVNELLAAVQLWRTAFGNGNFDALATEMRNFEQPKLPTIKSPPPEKEAIQAAIESIRKQMKEGSLAKIGRFTEQQWRDGMQNISPAIETLVDLTHKFGQQFARAKSEIRGMDFADLERFTLQVVSDGKELKPSLIAQLYQKQFKHVLVDEYQDINDVQDAILKLICRPGGDFCVGDVKQSIYRFRLAQPKRFLERYKLFKRSTPSPGTPGEGRGEGSASKIEKTPHPNPLPEYRAREQDLDGEVIDLGENFRSRGPLIEVINHVFERLMTEKAAEIEYDQSHRLKPGAIYPTSAAKSFTGSPVELHLLPKQSDSENSDDANEDLDRTEREAALVAQRINELIAAKYQITEKDGSQRPLKYRDIVVLLRSMKYKSEQFAQILRAADIPVHSDSSTGFFDSMEIRDMIGLLKLLDNQQQDIPMAAVLRSPLAGLADVEDCLAKIRLAFPNTDEVLFHQAVVKYAAEKDDELAAHLRGFLLDLNNWRTMSRQRPLAELIWHVYDSTGYLAFCAGMKDGPQRVANLIDFHERARQFGTFQRQGLSRFMDFLKSLAEQSDLGQPSIASQADDVVRVMSIHRSKGLEFPVVFLPDLGKKHNLADTRGPILVDREAGIGMMVADPTLRVRYPSLAHFVVEDRIRKQSLAEELRVLYVAMTRAREHLILVGTCDESTPQKWTDEWADHVGPLPAERVLGAGCMLDWLGPVAAMTKNQIEIIWHNELLSTDRRATLSDVQKSMADLVPLKHSPPVNPRAEEIKRLLTTPYAFQKFAILPAAQSVGTLTKQDRIASGLGKLFEPELSPPRAVIEEVKLSAAEAGSDVHLILQHLDFSRACDREDLKSQISDLVDKNILAANRAQDAMLDSIAWFVGTPLGRLMKQNAKTLRREVPIFYPLSSPAAVDPLDRVMVRGRIDVLVPDGDDLVLIDYKTDRVTKETFAARAEFYQPQVASYRAAIEAITGKRVKSASLVFLTAQIVHEINPNDETRMTNQ